MFDPRVGEISVVRFPHDRTMSIRFPIPSLETASASASASGHFSSSEQNRIIVVAVAAVAASPVHKIKLHFFQFSNFVRVNLAELWVRECVCVCMLQTPSFRAQSFGQFSLIHSSEDLSLCWSGLTAWDTTLSHYVISVLISSKNQNAETPTLTHPLILSNAPVTFA